MKGTELRRARKLAGWTQERLARRLGVTQAYVSFMERGRRRVPGHLASRASRALGLPETALPFRGTEGLSQPVAGRTVERALARLGYPGFAYRRRPGALMNPAEVLMLALSLDDLDPRVAEALPWLLLRFEGFDAEDLAARARARNLQNRLGFNVGLALEVAAREPSLSSREGELRRLAGALEPSRLAREDTYGRPVRSRRMRRFLRANRSPAATHWNLLTDLKPEHLSHVTVHS